MPSFEVKSTAVAQDDDVYAWRGAGLDVGLGVTDLFQAVADLRDRDYEAPCGDGLELAGEDVGREVGGLTAVGLRQEERRLNAQSPTYHAAILQIYSVPPARDKPAPLLTVNNGAEQRRRLR